MNNIIQVKGEDYLTPFTRIIFMLLFPIMAFVQFFYSYDLWIAVVVAVLLLILAAVGYDAHYTYQFDTETGMHRKSLTLFKWCFGKWKSIDFEKCHITFQMFTQKFEINVLNIYSTHTNEEVFSVRLVRANSSYETLAETTEFPYVVECLRLCKHISNTYGLTFHDYVKELAKKSKHI